jgi:hypothetical protein
MTAGQEPQRVLNTYRGEAKQSYDTRDLVRSTKVGDTPVKVCC